MSNSPFSENDLRNMRRMASSLAECELEIERAKCGGLPCEEAEARCKHLREAYAKLLAEYQKPRGV